MVKIKKRFIKIFSLTAFFSLVSTAITACYSNKDFLESDEKSEFFDKKEENNNLKTTDIKKDGFILGLKSLKGIEERDQIDVAKIEITFLDKSNKISTNNDVIVVFESNKKEYRTKINSDDEDKKVYLNIEENVLNNNNVLQEIWVTLEEDNNNLEHKIIDEKKYFKIYKNTKNDFFINNDFVVNNQNTNKNDENNYTFRVGLKGNENIINSKNFVYQLNWLTNNKKEIEKIQSPFIELNDDILEYDSNLIRNRSYNLVQINIKNKKTNQIINQNLNLQFLITKPSKTKIVKANKFVGVQNEGIRLNFVINSKDDFFANNQILSFRIKPKNSKNYETQIIQGFLKKQNENIWRIETNLIKNLKENEEYIIDKVVFGDNIDLIQIPNNLNQALDLGFYESLNDDVKKNEINFLIPLKQNTNKEAEEEKLTNHPSSNQNNSNNVDSNKLNQQEKEELKKIIQSLNFIKASLNGQNTFGSLVLAEMQRDSKNVFNFLTLENTLLENQTKFNLSFDFSQAFLNDATGNLDNIAIEINSKKFDDISEVIHLSAVNFKTRVVANQEYIELYKKHFPSLILAAIIYNLNKKENTKEYQSISAYEKRRNDEIDNDNENLRYFLSFDKLTNQDIGVYFENSSVDFSANILEKLIILKNQTDIDKYDLEVDSATASDIKGTLTIGYSLINKNDNSEKIQDSIILSNFTKINEDLLKDKNNNYIRTLIFDTNGFRRAMHKKFKKFVENQVAKQQKEIDLLPRIINNRSSGYWNRFFAYSLFDEIENTNYSQKNFLKINEYETIEYFGFYPFIYRSNIVIDVKEFKVMMDADSNTKGKIIIKYKKNFSVLDDQDNLINNFSSLEPNFNIESDTITLREIPIDLSKSEW